MVHTVPFPSKCCFLSKHIPNPRAAATPPQPGWRHRVEAQPGWSRAAELTCSMLSPRPPDRLSSTLTIHVFSKSTTNPFRLFLFATFLNWPRSKVGDFYGAKGRTQNRSERQKGALMERVKTFPSEQRHPLIHQNIMVELEQSHATVWGALHSGNTSPRGCWAWHAPRS